MMVNKKINKLTAFLLVLIISISGLNVTVLAQTNSNDAGNDNIVNYVDTELNKLIEDKLTVGITASIVKDSQVVLCKGYGYADKKNGINVSPDNTTFRIGSVSKTFVAFTAMQLAEQGKLDLDKPISEYLEPDFLNLKYPVTMKNLLTHTAGFEDRITSDTVKTANDIVPLKDYVKGNMPNQVFKPGEVSAYSNYGFALAGYVIEKVSGMSFYDYAEKNIFEPLKMNNTTFKPAVKGVISKTYSSGDEKIDLESNDYPAGSVTSTAQDMAKYIQYLLDDNESILSNKSKQEMFKQNFAMDINFPGIGYAWQRHSMNNHIFYTHNGTIGNFTSTIAIYPEENLGVFISCNQTGDFSLEEYTYNIAVKLYGEDERMPPYKGENTRDISGWYVSARSSFEGNDKILNYFFLGSLFKHVTGNPKDGFKVNGEKLTPVGVDAYQVKSEEYIRFIQKDDNLFYAPSQYYTSYVRVPWYEGETWQLSILLAFIAISLSGFMISMFGIIIGIKNKKDKHLILINIPVVAVFIIFVVIVTKIILQYNYLTDVYGANVSLDLDKTLAFIQSCSILLSISGLLGAGSAIYRWLKKQNRLTCLFYSIWSVIIILFISLLNQLNLVSF